MPRQSNAGCGSTGLTSPIAVPSFLGAKTLLAVPLEEIVPFIDWSPFFMSWELKGKYPRIFDEPEARPAGPRAFRRRPEAAADRSSPRSA